MSLALGAPLVAVISLLGSAIAGSTFVAAALLLRRRGHR